MQLQNAQLELMPVPLLRKAKSANSEDFACELNLQSALTNACFYGALLHAADCFTLEARRYA